ncbi:sortilin-like [Asterias amurensis]|uniref:sortilin-like n=1 Tax=Asterias amurensis TaxID=7602 RepID=UPI003AB6068A
MAFSKINQSTVVVVFMLIVTCSSSVFEWNQGIRDRRHAINAADEVHQAEGQFDSADEKVKTNVEGRERRRVPRDVDPGGGGTSSSTDSLCLINDAQAQLKKHTQVYQFNDSNFNLAMIWTGTDGKELLALTTMEYGFFAAQSKLWISKDFGVTFHSINDLIDGAIIRSSNGIFKSSLDPQKIILVSYMEDMAQTQTRLYITEDGGQTFQKKVASFYLDGAIIFHATDPNKLLAHSPYQEFSVWISDDFGKSWTSVRKNVMIYSWGTVEMEPGTLFVATLDNAEKQNDESPSYTMLRSTDYGKSFKKIKDDIYSFGVQGKFVFAAMDGSQGDNSRLLYVSKDDGSTWNPTQLPIVNNDRFFSVLDMNEGMVFMHVDNEGDTGAGTLYTSDADGIVFSVSLEQHLFPEGSTITDFYRVTSVRGVYLASQVESTDQSVHTVITFDRGGVWQPVKAPKDSKCKDSATSCNLQIHNHYSQFKGVNAPSAPLSQPNATGLILAHGNVADSLETHAPDVFVSNDGGYNWTRALVGPHHYTITNHGGLLLAIPAEKDSTNTIKFSYDEGHCWNEYEFYSEPLTITGLLPEPSAKSLNISIWGFGPQDRKWRVITVDFSAILTTECKAANFIEWVPHESNNQKGCLLGLKETFERVKPDSRCRLSYSHQNTPKRSEPCLCNKDDYECDFGFSRDIASDECEVSPGIDPSNLDICINGVEEQITTWGYRKIPGDVCVYGFEPERSFNKLQEKCKNVSSANQEGAPKTAAIVMILLVIVMFSGGLLFLLHRHNKLPCHKQNLESYRYSQLSQGDALDKIIDLETQPTFHDSSDEEMLE